MPRTNSFRGIAILLRPLLIILICALAPISNASHISGVDIEWECVGQNQFRIDVNIYRDCAGIPMPTTVDITMESNCGATTTVTLNQTASSGIEISQLCPQDLPNSTCNGGMLPGMQHYIYSGVITLNPQCDPWRVSWTSCCRNAAIVNLLNPGAASMFAEALLYTQTDTCNNSPQFTSHPIPYVCVNQPVYYNYGVVDPDGDSLAFGFIPARGATATALLPYVPGFGPLQPLQGLTVDPLTGAITFTPTALGQYVVVMLVEEFDANGNIIGEVMRDMQFTVISCPTNTPPSPSSALNVTGNVTSLGPNSFLICPGENLSFDVIFSDSDPNDTIILNSNVIQTLPGATFTQSGVNPATATITWTATALPFGTSTSFFVSGADNGCPIPAFNHRTIFIQLADTVKTVPDVILCNGGGTQLFATGGSSYQWSVLSGPPLVVGSNFSCNPCQDPIASPTTTTTYMVESNVVGQCLNTDTVVVNVVPPFGFGSVNYSDVTCFGAGDGTISLTPIGAAGPPWTWELLNSAGTLVSSATTVSGYTFSNLGPGTYTVVLNEPIGCLTDSLVVIDEPLPMTISAGDTTICLSQTATITAAASGGNGSYSFSWSGGLSGNGPHNVSPITTTYFTVVATDPLGCTSPLDSFLVEVNPPLSLNPSWSDSICVGEPASMLAVGSGGDGGPYNFNWVQLGVGPIGTGSSITFTPTDPSTDVTVTMTDNCGSPPVSVTLPIVWHRIPQPIFTPDTTEGCAPAHFSFLNETDPLDVGNTCIWDFGDGTVLTGACGNVNHVYQTPGCYDVSLMVYSPAGCPGDSTVLDLICVRPRPLADFNFGPQPAYVEDPLILFQNTSVNGISYYWQFGVNGFLGNTSATDPAWLFPGDNRGFYPVTLTTTNEFGCTDSITQVVVIDADNHVYIPNSFTPDGDGLNNVFQAIGIGISQDEFSMQIFNRWGELIYESEDPYIGWDGSKAIQGVFAYRIRAKDRYTLIVKEYLGHVTLLR